MNTLKEARGHLFESMKADKIMDNFLKQNEIIVNWTLENGINEMSVEVVQDENVFMIDAIVDYFPAKMKTVYYDGYPKQEEVSEERYEVAEITSATLTTDYDTFNFDEELDFPKIKEKLVIY